MFFLLTAILFTALQLFAQPFRYSETVFETADTIKNVEYSTAPWLNNLIQIIAEYNVHDGENKTEMRPLFMDVFSPHGDTVTKRPAIIFAHSGAFMLGSRKNDDMIALCDSFARRGYVTATIDYRLGMGAQVTRFIGMITKLEVTEKNANRAAYRALQDSRAAIRFLKHNAETFGIDSTKIYMAGSSAGAFATLANIYLDKNEELPPEVFSKPTLGCLDSFGVQGYNSIADAVISLWGAIQNTNIIENDTTPVLLVHGEADDVVPFGKGIPLEGMVEPNPVYSLIMPETFGSYCIDTALINRNVFHETYFVENKKHEFYGVVTGNFPAEGPNEYWDTIQWKISSFLFDRFQPKADFDFQTNDLTVYLNSVSTEGCTAKWEFENDEIEYGNSIVHTFAEQGTYKIKLTACNRNLACDTISKLISIEKSTSVFTVYEETVKIYPNPVRNTIYIKGITESYNAIIYDLLGRKRISIENSEENYININSFESALYILEIELNGIKIRRKIFKQ